MVRYHSCEHNVLQTDELVLMQTGTSGSQGKGMKRSTSWVKRSKIKVSGGAEVRFWHHSRVGFLVDLVQYSVLLYAAV